MTGFKKDEVVAIVETKVTTFAFGSGRPSETSYSIRVVRVEGASRDGVTIKSYSTYPGSPVYKYENRYNRFKLLTIGGPLQDNAKRLYDAAKYFLDFDTQDAVKAAIVGA